MVDLTLGKHVHPAQAKGKPVAIGMQFTETANGDFGVRWRDGKIEEAGGYRVGV